MTGVAKITSARFKVDKRGVPGVGSYDIEICEDSCKDHKLEKGITISRAKRFKHSSHGQTPGPGHYDHDVHTSVHVDF